MLAHVFVVLLALALDPVVVIGVGPRRSLSLFFLLSCRSWSAGPRGCQSCLEGSLLFIDLVPACTALSPVWPGGVVSVPPPSPLPGPTTAADFVVLRSAESFLFCVLWRF